MPFVMKSIENSCEILSLMSCKMSFNCIEMGNINDIINNIMTKSVFLTTSITGAHRSRTALLEVKMYKPCVISYGVLHFVSEQIHGLIA